MTRSGWPTPCVEDLAHRDLERRIRDQRQMGVSEIAQLVEPVSTGAKLNPAFVLWLMGYPAEWTRCAERAR